MSAETMCTECGQRFQPGGWEVLGRRVKQRVCNSCISLRSRARKVDELRGRLGRANVDMAMCSYDRDLGRKNLPLLEWCMVHRYESMWVAGATGSGKSRCLCRCMAIDMWRSARITGLYCPTFDWVRQVCAMMGHDNRYAAEAAIRRAKTVGILILDDLGNEALTERGGEIIFAVVDARMRARQRIWVSTNATPEDIDAHMGGNRGPALRRRLGEYCWQWPSKKAPVPASQSGILDGLE